jgi:hypothetical protein
VALAVKTALVSGVYSPITTGTLSFVIPAFSPIASIVFPRNVCGLNQYW